MVNIFEKILKERVEKVSKNIGKKMPIYNQANVITGYAPYPHKDLFEDPIVEHLLSARQFIVELYDEDDIFREYNTFGELYEHRIRLFIKLCNLIGSCYIQEEHYKGWDAVYLLLPEGQISYHLPVEYRKFLPLNRKLVDSSFYNGHTSQDVLEILLPDKF